MNVNKIGIFIKELRKEKKISQEKLAESLFIDRSLVSKWENGKITPDIIHITKLCKIFDISLEEMVYCERKNNKNKDEIQNNFFNYIIKEGIKNKRIKRIMQITIIMFFLVTFLFFLYYFINTYNSISIYKVSYANSNSIYNSGLLIITRDKSYLKFDNSLSEEITIVYKDKKSNDIIFKGNPNVLITDTYGYNIGINLYNYERIKNNIYINVNGEEYKLIFDKIYSNYNLFFHKDTVYKNTDDYKYNISIIPRKINEKFSCQNDYCNYSKDNINYLYVISSSTLYVFSNNINIEYNLSNKTFINNNKKNQFSVDSNYNVSCYSKKCSEEIKIYEKYYSEYIEQFI